MGCGAAGQRGRSGLCGAQLRFRQLAIDERVAEVRLELALTVVAFPPPNASF